MEAAHEQMDALQQYQQERDQRDTSQVPSQAGSASGDPGKGAEPAELQLDGQLGEGAGGPATAETSVR